MRDKIAANFADRTANAVKVDAKNGEFHSRSMSGINAR